MMKKIHKNPLSRGISINMPLSSGEELVRGPINYSDDVLHTNILPYFAEDEELNLAFSHYIEINRQYSQNTIFLDWKFAIGAQLARSVIHLGGDLCEFGVYRAKLAYLIYEYCNLTNTNKRLLLYDSWEEWDEARSTDEEKAIGLSSHFSEIYTGEEMRLSYEIVSRLFANAKNVTLGKGFIPEIFEKVRLPDYICFASIDLNSWSAELTVLEHIWDRLVEGAVILFDDYGYPLHSHQARGLEIFCKHRSITPVALPTGQAILIKKRS